MATHCSILAWKIPWAEQPGRLQSMGLQESDTTEQLNHRHHAVDREVVFMSTKPQQHGFQQIWPLTGIRNL